jgi:predicted deacylase
MNQCYIEGKTKFTFESGISGPKIVILAGVHGNELPGIIALKEFIASSPKLLKGKVTCIFANPHAIEKNIRFVETNLNRCFSKRNSDNTYEDNLARELMFYLDNADICLDLHASYTQNTEPMIICQPNAYPYIQSLLPRHVCHWFLSNPTLATDQYMFSQGKVGICVECGYLDDIEGVSIAENAIQSILEHLGVLTQSSKLVIVPKTYYRAKYCYITKTNLVLQKQFPDFYSLSKGEVIGTDGGIIVRAEEDGYLLFARDRVRSNEEAFVFLTL